MPRGMGVTLAEARPDWTILDVWGDIMLGDPCRVQGESGTFRFVQHVTTAKGVTWVTVLGPLGQHQQYRSFRPERVRAASRKRRTQ